MNEGGGRRANERRANERRANERRANERRAKKQRWGAFGPVRGRPPQRPPFAAVALAALAMIAGALAGCGPWVALPPRGEHAASEERVAVPYPPPPPKAEILPEPPVGARDVVWIDGEWMWRGRRWEWTPGRWETPPAGASYAPADVLFLEDKRIVWRKGTWKIPPAR